MKDYNADRLQNILRSVRRSALPFYRRTARVLVLKATMSGRHRHRPTFCFGVLPFATPNISGRGSMQKGHQQCNCLIAFLALTTANSICFESPESPMRMRREFLTRCFAYNSHQLRCSGRAVLSSKQPSDGINSINTQCLRPGERSEDISSEARMVVWQQCIMRPCGSLDCRQ